MSNETPKSEVFAIHGAEPEVLAYAMAKYSRSALTIKQALKEIGSQRASEFLNTFYFQYGHKSIADLAHVPMALENISLLAAIEVVDEQRWDGQERSTRYQDYSKRHYYTPHGLNAADAFLYHATIATLFNAYDEVFSAAYNDFAVSHPKPEGMDEGQYQRTLKARSFDVARYLLPMATLTSVGQITNARTLENQISRMMGSDYPEVREIGQKLKDAASNPCINPNAETPGDEIAVAPTLVKYTEASSYAEKLKDICCDLAIDIGVKAPRSPKAEPVDTSVKWFIPQSGEIEMVATAIYEYSLLSFTEIYNGVLYMGYDWTKKAIERLTEARGPHDEMPRFARSLGGVIFEITTDIGAYRDLHRHRRATHFRGDYQGGHFNAPEPCSPTVRSFYEHAVTIADNAYTDLVNGENFAIAAYVLPLGTQVKSIMKMDIAEAAYIAELRTTPAGHISYRRVAWGIFEALKEIAPRIADTIAPRVKNPDEPVDFFKR